MNIFISVVERWPVTITTGLENRLFRIIQADKEQRQVYFS
jgi:hypothetical protein